MLCFQQKTCFLSLLQLFLFLSGSCEFSHAADVRKRSFELTVEHVPPVVITSANLTLDVIPTATPAVIHPYQLPHSAIPDTSVHPSTVIQSAGSTDNDYCPMAPVAAAVASPLRPYPQPPPPMEIEIPGDYCLMSVSTTPGGQPRLEPVVGANVAAAEAPLDQLLSSAALTDKTGNDSSLNARTAAAPAAPGRKLYMQNILALSTTYYFIRRGLLRHDLRRRNWS